MEGEESRSGARESIEQQRERTHASERRHIHTHIQKEKIGRAHV